MLLQRSQVAAQRALAARCRRTPAVSISRRRWFATQPRQPAPGAHQTGVVANLWEMRGQTVSQGLDPSGPALASAATAARSTVIPTAATATRAPPQAFVPVPKSTQDAAKHITYDFDTNPELQDKYRSPWGQVRMGRIFEDLDAMAGTIAYDHCRPVSEHLHLVTASVDRLTVHERPDINKKMAISGRVVWTGRSSMVIEMTASEPATHKVMLQAGFTFVARDRATNLPQSVNPVVPSTAEEAAAYQRHEARAVLRKARREHRAVREDEVHSLASELLVDAMQRATTPMLPSLALLAQTRQENSFICQPQHRNTSGRIFGGFLMRRAFELAHSTAYCFSSAMNAFVEVDEVLFLSPVEIGNLIQLESCVLYANDPPGSTAMHVEVLARVVDVERETSALSNVFHFTFKTTGARPLRTVLPASLEEGRRIAARRIAEREQDADFGQTGSAPTPVRLPTPVPAWDPYR
eukprot:m.117109 g.117109  ORF g.117109 m.117109 type:complete len:466 (+) comp21674_c0_seq1:156-1553(+)